MRKLRILIKVGQNQPNCGMGKLVYQHTRVPFTLCIIIEYILDYKLVAVDR
jgi:hypothetical protein